MRTGTTERMRTTPEREGGRDANALPSGSNTRHSNPAHPRMHAHNHGGDTVRQAYTSVGWGPCSGPLHTGEAYVDDTPYHRRGVVGRLNQPAARIESNAPVVATAQLKNRRIRPSNCLTNFTSGLLRFSLSYIPSEHLRVRFLPAASPRTNEVQRRPVLVRFCKTSRPAHRDLAGWPVAEGTLPW